MKDVYAALEKRLLAVDGLKMVSLFNGEPKDLDKIYHYPCALVQFGNIDYVDGLDGYQVGSYTVSIYLLIKGIHKEVLNALELVDRVLVALHKYQLTDDTSPMMRASQGMPDVWSDLFVFEQVYTFMEADRKAVVAPAYETVTNVGQSVTFVGFD